VELDRESKTDEVEELATGKLALAMREGDLDMGSLMAGQCSSLIGDVIPAGQIIDQMIAEAEDVMARIGACTD